jgi:hypothetical protein
MKTIEERLADALDKVKAKSAKAAKTIAESAVTIEERLATCYELIEGSTRCGQLTQLIRESSYAFDGPATIKHNGVLDNHGGAVRESADDTRSLVYESAKRMGMTDREARLFADPDHDERGERVRNAILNS